ncbi:MAG: DUF2817 domain-containing protein [Burkholderiaceae bacterium]
MSIDQTHQALHDEPPLVDYFPASYHASRERLLSSLGSISQKYPVMIDSRSINAKGPDGETLAQDFVMIGARQPRHVFLISCATHGVEGFAGSAIQHDFLENKLPQLALAPDTAIVIVHGHNPYGFAWLRRVTENNVDLNRNFVEHFDTELVSEDYRALYDLLNPPDLDPEKEVDRWAELEEFVATNGMPRTQKAITEGQYHYPGGVQFGGQAREESAQNLLALVTEHLAQAQTVIWIDIHTGLGELGDCELISGVPKDSDGFRFTQKIWPEARSADGGESLSAPLHGVIDVGLSRAMPAGCQFAMVFPEFGTYPVVRVIQAMRADNWLHQHGPDDVLEDPIAKPIKAELLEAFRPDDAQWRMTIQKTGREIINQGIAAMAGIGPR